MRKHLQVFHFGFDQHRESVFHFFIIIASSFIINRDLNFEPKESKSSDNSQKFSYIFLYKSCLLVSKKRKDFSRKQAH